MRKIIFAIKGNHQDPTGNPFPKLKMTGKQSWTPKAQAYVMWKRYVQSELIKRLRVDDPELARDFDRNIISCGKPIVIDNLEARMDLEISFKNGMHGDPENIFGSIADALFFNDKNLYGSFVPLEGRTGGEVWCTITVSDIPVSKSGRRIYK